MCLNHVCDVLYITFSTYLLVMSVTSWCVWIWTISLTGLYLLLFQAFPGDAIRGERGPCRWHPTRWHQGNQGHEDHLLALRHGEDRRDMGARTAWSSGRSVGCQRVAASVMSPATSSCPSTPGPGAALARTSASATWRPRLLLSYTTSRWSWSKDRPWCHKVLSSSTLRTGWWLDSSEG
jgi:hypothetical protein